MAYTDGACLGNPGPGGWGVVLLQDPDDALHLASTYHGGHPNTTSNRMELQAAVQALLLLESGATVEVRTDSQYLVKGMTEWMPGWIRRNWRNAAKAPVKNRDLWEKLGGLCASRRVRWVWVEGHAGNPGNEMADRLAVAGAEENRQG